MASGASGRLARYPYPSSSWHNYTCSARCLLSVVIAVVVLLVGGVVVVAVLNQTEINLKLLTISTLASSQRFDLDFDFVIASDDGDD